jgi:peptidoglycan/LPS O-acetylase OafA/YrhL
MTPGFAGQAPNYSLPQLASHLFYIVPLTRYQWLNPVYWSLAYEFVFYITVGLTFSYLIERSVAVTVVLAFGVLGLSFAVYRTADLRIIEFLIGALLMRSAVSDAKDVQTGAWLVASLVLVFLIGGIAGGIALSLAAGAILLLRSVEFGGCAIFLGSMSYSLYLGRVINLTKRFGQGPLYELVIVALALSASLVVAMLLHRFVEVPAMMASRKIGRRFQTT